MAVQVLSPHPPHNADIHSIPHGQPEHSHTQSHAHADLEDKIPVAALDDGGPAIHPGNLTEPVWFKYEVSSGAPLQLPGPYCVQVFGFADAYEGG